MDNVISSAFDYPMQYADVLGSRMAYVDIGRGDPIVFLHGNPSSSYLWRNVIPHLQGVGRCIAVDLIGMGRSDKPELDYRFADHARYLDAFLSALALERVTFVLHDWGSALGLDWAMRHPERVRGLALMEAFITPIADWEAFSPQVRDTFLAFRTPGVGERMVLEENIFIEQLVPGAVLRKLSEAEMQHYRAPFLEPTSRKPMLVWPREIPIAGEPADVAETVTRYRDALTRSPIPKLLLTFEPGGLVRKPIVDFCRSSFPSLDIVHIGPGLHYVQEDHPHAIGQAIADWYARRVTPLDSQALQEA